MNFLSDNSVGVHPDIISAIVKANTPNLPYGNDQYSVQLSKSLEKVFERPVRFALFTTGTAANSMGISTITPTYSTVFCSAVAHILVDECNAPIFFSHGISLTTVSDEIESKISIKKLRAAIDHTFKLKPNHAVAGCISITQPTESGLIYSIDEITEITKVAREFGLKVHMDGARIGNAVAKLNCTISELSWKAGIDLLVFGGTKNGLLNVDSLIYFNEKDAQDLEYYVKRSGHLASKGWFLSAQFLAYLDDDLWLKNARNANDMAALLVKSLADNSKARVINDVAGNEIFLEMKEETAERLRSLGYLFYTWEDGTYRIVTSWSTTEEQILNLVSSISS